MIRLLRLEWYKFSRNRVVQVMVGLFIICMSTLLLLGNRIKDVPPPLPNNQVFFRFPSVWDYQGYIGNWLVFFFLGVAAIFMTSSEFYNKTLRQNIIQGLTRREVFLAKFGMGGLLALGATLLFAFTTIVYGIIHTPDFAVELIFEKSSIVPRFFLMSLAYIYFGILLALVFRKSGLSTFLYLAYILFIELILRWGIHMQIWESRSSLFYPMNVVEDLAPNPLIKLTQNMNIPFELFLSPWEATIATSVYLVIMIYISYRILMKGAI